MRTATRKPEYELFYWPGIQGRGEFVRLAFADAGVAYDDVGRRPEAEGGGVAAIEALLEGGGWLAPLGPPALRHGEVVVGQTAAILQYVAPRIGVVPEDQASQLRAHQIQLTVADLVAEAHDAHHPIAVSLYYEDQREEARRRAGFKTRRRAPRGALVTRAHGRIRDRGVQIVSAAPPHDARPRKSTGVLASPPESTWDS